MKAQVSEIPSNELNAKSKYFLDNSNQVCSSLALAKMALKPCGSRSAASLLLSMEFESHLDPEILLNINEEIRAHSEILIVAHQQEDGQPSKWMSEAGIDGCYTMEQIAKKWRAEGKPENTCAELVVNNIDRFSDFLLSPNCSSDPYWDSAAKRTMSVLHYLLKNTGRVASLEQLYSLWQQYLESPASLKAILSELPEKNIPGQDYFSSVKAILDYPAKQRDSVFSVASKGFKRFI